MVIKRRPHGSPILMKTLSPTKFALWTLLSTVALAGVYAAGRETTNAPEITEEESREVADLIQPRTDAQPAPAPVQGKEIQAPVQLPRTRLVTPKPAIAAPPPGQTTAQNS